MQQLYVTCTSTPLGRKKNNTRCRQYIIVFLLHVYSLFIYYFPPSFRFCSPLSNLEKRENGKAILRGTSIRVPCRRACASLLSKTSGCSKSFILRLLYTTTRCVLFSNIAMIYARQIWHRNIIKKSISYQCCSFILPRT